MGWRRLCLALFHSFRRNATWKPNAWNNALAASIFGRPRLMVARDDSWGSGADTLYQLAGRKCGKDLSFKIATLCQRAYEFISPYSWIFFIVPTSIEYIIFHKHHLSFAQSYHEFSSDIQFPNHRRSFHGPKETYQQTQRRIRNVSRGTEQLSSRG